MKAPTLDFFHDSQEPTNAEWSKDRAWDGTKYVHYARGKHGGWDFQNKGSGKHMFAVEGGIARHVDFGPYLGNRQFVIESGGGGWFYAHAETRPANGERIKEGEFVGLMGAQGTSFIHLHLEYLSQWNDWYSTVNRTDDLHYLWEEADMARLSDADVTWLENFIRQAKDNGMTWPAGVVNRINKAVNHADSAHEHTHPSGDGHVHEVTVTLD